MNNSRKVFWVFALSASLVLTLSGCVGATPQGSSYSGSTSTGGNSNGSESGGESGVADIRQNLVEKLAEHCPGISGYASTASSWIVDASTTTAPYYVYLEGDGGAVVLWFSPESSGRPFEVDAEYAETTNQ